MRVITGLPAPPTPSFHAVMEYIVVNPYWKIPESIVKKEMLSKLIRDPYYFMQVPGTGNALGKIKFLFPNGYSVYIHDTPTKKLFFKNVRAFSHGCMRIQKPRELLKVLALYNDNIDVDEIMARLGTREKRTIALKRKVPVDITYLTAYIDPYGNLNFRKDIYHYDKYQLEHYAYNPAVAQAKASPEPPAAPADGKSPTQVKK
jgi:murein L,D-transpeptidase YcbB/YkuD